MAHQRIEDAVNATINALVDYRAWSKEDADADFANRLRSELKDFISHEVHRYQADLSRKLRNGPTLNPKAKKKAEETAEILVSGARDLCARIFNYIPHPADRLPGDEQ